MQRYILATFAILLFFAQHTAFAQWPSSLVGRWTFDNTLIPTQASLGNDLILTGWQTPVSGPSPGDNAVRLGQGSYYTCYHGIPTNGGGSPGFVNQFSILIDFRIRQYGMWRCFYQTDYTNGSMNDGDAFISPSGNIGIGVTGYSSYIPEAGEWYRLVISANLGNHYDYYLDGQLLLNGGAQIFDGRFALYPSTNQNQVLFLADNDGEDNIIDVAQIAIFNTDLSAPEISALGGFGHNTTTSKAGINPYLQTPTPTSIYVSWHSGETASTVVQYGTSPALGLSSSGAYEYVLTKTWHTVKLSGLNPDTHYFYRCISGNDTSQIYEFRTAFLPGTPNKHVRIVIMADSQSDINMPAMVSNAIQDKFEELYGDNWEDSVSIIIRPGDMVGNGLTYSAFEDEYFSPFGNLSHSIPSMIAIGNHENESSFYYTYVKYEDVSDYSYPNPLTERYYSFELGNCKFIALNTNGSFQNGTQLTWLHDKLFQSDNNSDIDFVFTYGHHPGHSEMWPDGNTSWVQNSVLPELAGHPKAVLHSYGHSHNYERGIVKSTHSEPQDFRIMCAGGAGAYLDRWGMYGNQTDYPEVHRAADHYSFILVDVDVDAQSYHATMYSLGHPELRRYNEVMDQWHYSAPQPRPNKPLALAPNGNAIITPLLVASVFSGFDSVMSSQFQITASPGNWSSPLVDNTRDMEDLYGDSGPPFYNSIDLNTGIDLQRLQINAGVLLSGSTYEWRIRYRDQNIKWSEWSDPVSFTVVPSVSDSADFVADTTFGFAPLHVQFTDLSSGYPTGWIWDFDNDGNPDSYVQDPSFTYMVPGIYTVDLTCQYGTDSSIMSKTAYIIVNQINGEESHPGGIEAMVFPNPSSTSSNLQISLLGRDCLTITIFDLSGRRFSIASDKWFEEGITNIRLDQLFCFERPGIYFCTISGLSGTSVLKIVRIM